MISIIQSKTRQAMREHEENRRNVRVRISPEILKKLEAYDSLEEQYDLVCLERDDLKKQVASLTDEHALKKRLEQADKTVEILQAENASLKRSVQWQNLVDEVMWTGGCRLICPRGRTSRTFWNQKKKI